MNEKIVYNPAGEEYNIPSLTEIEDILNTIEKLKKTSNSKECRRLMKNNLELYEKKMIDEFNEFSEKYYGIFYKIIKHEDISPVFDMLDKLIEINKGSMTIQKAEEQIGISMSDKYTKKL